MGKAFIFFAQVDGTDLLLTKPTSQYTSNLTSLLVIVIGGLILTVILFSLVYFFRSRRKPSHRPHRPAESRPPAPRVEADDESEDRIRVRKKRRERIREHRPRNPTLQETGGLPPVRPDDELPKS
ncbi:MAG: hypothetical protein EXS33_08660 [Pedosphaera sp.]|nr:hypothetical protein [Pedosphaera sp.]